jgi:YD repeat-containing protein
VASTTDSEGYELQYVYDNLDRRTATVYPDGTSEKTIYDRLDAVLHSDRLGRWTRDVYDSLDQLSCETDALGRTTKYCWCNCGSLAALTDPNGNVTNWHHDLEGRVIQKDYPDNSTVNYVYESNNSRLSSKTDALGQTTQYYYGLDDSLTQKTYLNATNATSNVSNIFDWTFPRTTSVTNGWGTNAYNFNPYNMVLLTGTPTTGDIVNVVFYGTTFGGPSEYDFQYTVLSTDTTLATLASSIATAINGTAALSTKGFSAAASSGKQRCRHYPAGDNIWWHKLRNRKLEL